MGRVIGWIVVVLLFVGLVGALLRGGAVENAREKLARYRADYERDRTALAANALDRPALVEPALPGNAWDEIVALAREATEALPEPKGGAFPDPGASAAFLEGATAADRLRSIPRMSCRAPGFFEEIPEESAERDSILWLFRVVQMAGSHWTGTGRSDATCSLAAHAFALGSDVQRFDLARPFGTGYRSWALGALRQVLRSDRIQSPTAADAAALLDATEVHAVSIAAELHIEGVRLRRRALRIAERGPWSGSVERTWDRRRWYWSRELQAVSALEHVESGLAEAQRVTSTAAPARWVLAQGVFAATPSSDTDPYWWPENRRRLAGRVVSDDSHGMHRVLCRAGLAIAAHVAEHGTAPESLDSLVPARMPSIPVCPLSGQPLRYAASPCRVWSVGLDGDDDGGRPGPDPHEERRDGDVVYEIRTSP